MNLNNERYTTGADVDNRTADQKSKDWRPQEAFAFGAPLKWKEKTIKEVESEILATSISQWSTSRCVSEYAGIFFEYAEYHETGNRTVFSRRDVYCRRFNRPAPGMAMWDLFKIMREGTCLESQLPSTDRKEEDINKEYVVTDEMKAARSKYAADSSFTFQDYTIDDIARMIDQKIPMCLFWYFDDTKTREWWRGYPKVIDTNRGLFNSDTARHQAAGVSYLLIDGVKHIAVLDSAGWGNGLGKNKNIRFVSEDFIKGRCFGAGFAIDKKNLDYKPEDSLAYTFTRNLKNGSRGDDVMALQKILVHEGCMSLKQPTTFFGGLTEAGVKKLQEKYAQEILAPIGLKKGTGNFFERTRSFINKKYNRNA
jgi:hypothetical protein